MAESNLLISELFYSIQGESSFAGLPCVFIRLAGCNLRCTYCDARYTYEEPGESTGITAIIDYTEQYPEAIIEITGGEPLLQNNVDGLLRELLRRNRTVLLETNGSLSIARVPDQVHVILDVKCPGSGAKESFHPDNLAEVQRRSRQSPGTTEIKFVVTNEEDLLWAKKYLLAHTLHQFVPVHFSPVVSSLSVERLADFILENRLPVRLQLQLHTLIWPKIYRGV